MKRNRIPDILHLSPTAIHQVYKPRCERWRDRQTDTETETGTQRETETGRQTEIETEIETETDTVRQRVESVEEVTEICSLWPS